MCVVKAGGDWGGMTWGWEGGCFDDFSTGVFMTF